MIAVSYSEYEKSGCVNCGCEFCHGTGMSGGGSTPVQCGECQTYFMILADGLEKSRIGFGGDNKETYYPTLQTHPRKDIPKHEYIRPDVKPDGEGEFWSPRGIGYDLSGFVKSKESGERIVAMVEVILRKKPKTWLDYRPSEPTWIQVKFQEEDGIDLKELQRLTKDDGIITLDKIKQSLIK